MPWSPPSEFVVDGVVFGITLVVFERDRAVGHVEDEGAKGAVVVFPAAVPLFKILPGEGFDRRFQVPLGAGISRVPGRELDFAIGRERDSFIAGIPGLDVLDLAGIAAAVVIDGGAVNTGFGKRRENNRFVRGVGIGDGRAAAGGSIESVMAVSLFCCGWRACEKTRTARPPVRGSRS